nr:hypothetical protein [Paraburkholderia bannensis]
MISSTVNASKNSLTTGTITFSDIQNQSHYSANSNGISAGVGVGSTSKAVGPGSVSGSGGVAPMISQNDSGDQSATTRSAISAGTINVTNGAGQSQDIAGLSRDTTNTNGVVAKTPDVNALLSQQADTMQAAQAAGQVVSQGIGTYADKKRNDAAAAGDTVTADAWDEGGENRVMAHIAGGALIGGLGGGALDAVGGAVAAGAAAKLADQLDALSKGVTSATGSELIGNLAANIAAGLGGTLVGGTAGAATGSAVQQYNQAMDDRKKKNLVAQICGAGTQCSDATLRAAIQAQGDLNSVAQGNVAEVSLVTTAAIATVAGSVLGPEAIAAYKAAQAAYSTTSAALTGAGISSAIYTGSATVGAAIDQRLHGADFYSSFDQRFSVAGVATAATVGAYTNVFATSMIQWAGLPNSMQRLTTIPGVVIQGNKLAIGQAAGKAGQAMVNSGQSQEK